MGRFTGAFAALILCAGMAWGQVITEAQVEEARQEYLAGNYDVAFAVLVPAAEQGDMVAQNIVGVGYQYGQGLPVDAKAAVRWLRASGEQGFGAAWHNLGYMYEMGMPGLAPDDRLARQHYERAVALDYNLSRANLGTLLREGRGGKVDLAGALDLYQAGVAGGDATAMDAMGWMYVNGLGVPADDVEARRYYQMASDSGLAQGTGNLAFMTEMGQGGPANLKLARQLYQRAIDGGHVYSAINMAWMITGNPQAFSNVAEGIAYCLWATENADPANVEEYRSICAELGAGLSDAILAEARDIANRL
jgi:TPR repeat protein